MLAEGTQGKTLLLYVFLISVNGAASTFQVAVTERDLYWAEMSSMTARRRTEVPWERYDDIHEASRLVDQPCKVGGVAESSRTYWTFIEWSSPTMREGVEWAE